MAIDALQRFCSDRLIWRLRSKELLEEQQRLCSSFGALEAYLDEVSARQMLDLELAMALAPSLGCRWVMGLDLDEIFYCPDVVAHFESLEEQDIEQMSYLNHEAVPERMETEDYFATTTLFKQHHFQVPLSPEARSGMRFWMDRSKRKQYFLFYDNGKSACRSGLGARCLSQHAWQVEGKSRTALADCRHMDVEGYLECKVPCILHYPVCGLAWLKAKYSLLGLFPSKWLGKVPLKASFHTDCRDAWAQSALEAKFQEVLLTEPREVARQLSSGTCMRLLDVAEVLEATGTVQDVEGTREVEVKDGDLMGIEKGWILSKAMHFL